MQRQDIDKLSFNEVVKCVETFDRECRGSRLFKISFLRNITLDLMMPYLKFLCYQEDLCAQIDIGNYDSALQDISGFIAGPDHAKSDLIIICLHPKVAAKKLYTNFSELSSEEIDEELATFLNYLEKVLEEARKRSSAPILLHNFEIPVYPTFGILDYQDIQKQVNVIRKINQEILRIANKYESVYIVDMDLLQSRLGSARLSDERFWHIARAPYSRDGYLAIAKEYIKFIRALIGKNKKCLILDCDNTLWGGIIGEDGLEGIKIGQTYPGSSYREFQEAILGLYNRGVLIALCSKNNQGDVEEVLEKHPDMILRKEHFVTMKVNWRDKAANIKEIAQELGIGLDSLVFVDDNEFEINMVKKMLPEVDVLLLPKKPEAYRRTLEEQGFFDAIFFSEEDKKRSDMYRAEVERKKAREQFKSMSIEDYLSYLEMKVFIGKADSFHIPRISQLTQRTNQFNLTAKRYAESEITDLINKNKSDIFYVTLTDRFGEAGVVGAAILTYEDQNAFIDIFLLSCRVIGRGIEEVMLKVCIDEARQKNCENIFGIYVPTKKNHLVVKFYEKHRFSKIETEESKIIHMLSLSKEHMTFPSYFKSIKVGDIEHLREEDRNE
ncbi:MAG: HAD family hydrolase [Candidatus Omnitrophota bacterium]|nr:MAG: HAD family hydrolase [Candidatus Omnitrophota bacterium]